MARWLSVVGFPHYEVSDEGQIRSVPRYRVRGGLLRLNTSNSYPSVYLYNDTGKHTVKVHVAVTRAFLGPKPEGMETRHLDGNKTNNSLSNLVYGTSAQNREDTVAHGRHHNAIKTHCIRGHKLKPYQKGKKRQCQQCHNLTRK